MKSTMLLLIAASALTACGPGAGKATYRTETRFRTPEIKERAAKFIVELCEKSNPNSDEEPEDMIKQAQWTAEKLFGEEVTLKLDETTGFYNEIRTDPK